MSIFMLYFLAHIHAQFFAQVTSGVQGMAYTPVVDTGSSQTHGSVKPSPHGFVGANPTPPTKTEAPKEPLVIYDSGHENEKDETHIFYCAACGCPPYDAEGYGQCHVKPGVYN